MFTLVLGVTWRIMAQAHACYTGEQQSAFSCKFLELQSRNAVVVTPVWCQLLGKTALCSARHTVLLQVWNNQPECVKRFLESGFTPDLQDGESGWYVKLGGC